MNGTIEESGSVAAVSHVDASQDTKQVICTTHGQYQSRAYFGGRWTKCPKCVDEEKQAREREEAERRDLELRSILLARIRDSNIPPRFMDRTLSSFVAGSDEQRHALDFAKSFTDQVARDEANGRCAVFVGKPGTGKTHLACGIALQAMEAGRSALYVTVARMIRCIRATYVKGSEESEADAIKLFTQPDLLILDEVGVQRGTEDEKNLLFDVLNQRYGYRDSTILLSNLSAKDLRGYLGERVFDRFREDGGEVVVFDWKSHRGEVAS